MHTESEVNNNKEMGSSKLDAFLRNRLIASDPKQGKE
jgi:hypothetical protein